MPLEGLYRLMQQNDAWERESMLPEEEEADHNVLTGLTDGSVVPEDDKVPRDDENSSSDWGSDGGQAPGPSKGKDTGKENDPIAFNPGLKLVTQQYFRSDAIELDHTRVTDDVLAFCSMVLSYAKAAQALDASPKKLLAFMPRTEFNTIFRQVKPKLPDDLFALFNSLACYKTEFSGNVV